METRDQNETVDRKELEQAAEESFDQASDDIKEELEGKLVVAFIGNVSSGKGSLINAIFGEEVASVHPIAGWTTEVQLFPVPEVPNLVIADTPGLEDVSEVISEKTRAFQENCDMFVYLVNGAVGCTKPDHRAYGTLVGTGNPVAAVVNKADTIRGTGEQMAEFISRTRGQLGAEGKAFFVVAADPDPDKYPKPIGIDPVVDWLLRTAKEEGKGLLMAKAIRDKRQAASMMIGASTAAAGLAGALPIPGSDYITLTAIQTSMLLQLSSIYGVTISKDTVVQFIPQVLTSGAGRQIFRLGIQGLKALGWLGGPFTEGLVVVLASAIAASITYGLGWAWVTYLESDLELPIEDIVGAFSQAYKARSEGNEMPSA